MKITKSANRVDIDFEDGIVYVNQQRPVITTITPQQSDWPTVGMTNVTFYGVPSNKRERILTIFKIVKLLWKVGGQDEN